MVLLPLLLVLPAAAPSNHINANAVEKSQPSETIADGAKEDVPTLANETKILRAVIEHLQAQNSELKNENLKMQHALQKLTSQPGGDHFGLSGPEDDISLTVSKLSILEEQTSEVIFNRALQVYDYKKDELHNFSWSVPYSAYAKYRNDHTIHGIPTLKGTKSVQYYEQALSSWNELDTLATGLREYSGGDDELYANMVLQVTHQFLFTSTDYTKHPLETFVEGTGDCDSLGIFAAALLKAGGLDSALIYGKAVPKHDGLAIGHALVGVKLDEEPDDHHNKNYSITEGRDEYYVGEPTWKKGIFEDPWNYEIHGSAIGDLAWKEFAGTVVKTPDRPFNIRFGD
jgi:hypothetical protein